MTDEEIQREREEAERLIREINATIDRINRVNQENAQLEYELEQSINSVKILIGNCGEMDKAVYEQMGFLSGKVGEADISTKHVFDAINELTTHIISSDNARKKVEKAYLQNTEYWLAYCISAVMLWASNEPEAAQRAMSKSLSVNYFNSCLFYLLINLRFNRIEAAKKWYVNYLDRADMNDLGDEWQYLLQAYLFGAFGSDEEFQNIVAQCFQNMLGQVMFTSLNWSTPLCAVLAVNIARCTVCYPRRRRMPKLQNTMIRSRTQRVLRVKIYPSASKMFCTLWLTTMMMTN